MSPSGYKPLLSWSMWGGNLCHGIVALIHCFDGDGPQAASARYQTETFGGKLNMDKLILAVPLWFGMFAANLYFTNKCFGSSLLPWDRQSRSTATCLLTDNMQDNIYHWHNHLQHHSHVGVSKSQRRERSIV